jgi:transketolase
MRKAFVETLLSKAKTDKSIHLITGDLGYGVLDKFAAELPEQFTNAGIAEQSMMGMAAGLASTGKKVFVYSIGNFTTFRCLEQIRNDVCLMNNSVVIVSVGAGYAYGAQGYTHHAIEDISIMRSLSNLTIFSPCDSFETTAITKYLSEVTSPSYLRLGKGGEPDIHYAEPEFKVGNPINVQEGSNGTILFTGSIGMNARTAHDILKKKDLNVGMYSVPTPNMLDANFIKTICEIGPVITVEENVKQGGFGSYFLESINQLQIAANVRIISAARTQPSSVGNQEYLRTQNGLGAEQIAEQFIAALQN